VTPAERLERTQWDYFWVPEDVTVVDRPELLYYTCPRPSPYLNTVLRARGEPAAMLAEVHTLPARMRWMITDTWDNAHLVRALSDAGYHATDVHEVRMLPVAAWRSRRPLVTHAVDSMTRLRDCVAVASAAFGREDLSTDASLAKDLAELGRGRVYRYVSYDAEGTPLGSGGLTAFPALGVGLLWAGSVAPEGRGRGAYTAVLDARIEKARELGLTHVGLFAKDDTSAPIVAKFGFERHGAMVYWERASDHGRP
jgi:hypothetical protein